MTDNLLTGNLLQDKIRGCFLGVAIGDALGKPVETYTPEEIASDFGRITDYQSNSKHKYFSEALKGTTTDDWQLTKAVAKAFINKNEFDLDEIAKQHCDEYLISVAGWGNSTRESIGSIVAGKHWLESGKTDKSNRGVGNGICMKVAPIGIYQLKAVEFWKQWTKENDDPKYRKSDFDKKIVQLAEMTHCTLLGAESGIAQVAAINYCMENVYLNKYDFLHHIIAQTWEAHQHRSSTENSVSLNDKFHEISKHMYYEGNGTISEENVYKICGKGSCYVYESLPFSYAWFIRNPNSIECLYDCVNAGGDTDTNGSMVGALLGALHGSSIFPKHLIDGLVEKEEVLEIADKFYLMMRT